MGSKNSNRLEGFSSDTKQIAAYPNPFLDILNMNIITDEDLTIKIKDVAGRVILTYKNINQSFNIEGKLNNGVYFINIENQSGSYKKVMKVIRAN